MANHHYYACHYAAIVCLLRETAAAAAAAAAGDASGPNWFRSASFRAIKIAILMEAAAVAVDEVESVIGRNLHSFSGIFSYY